MKDFVKGIVFIGIFAIPFIPIIVADSMFFPYITGKNFTFRIIVEVILAAWVILALLDRDYRPRFSWIMLSGGALLIVMFFANFLAEYSPRSLWSNFERMDGYVTLVHFYAYFVVLASTLRSPKLWSYFVHTSIFAALIVALFGLAQISGLADTRSAGRIESFLGNAAYMAVYMLFHVFLVVWAALRAKNLELRIFYGLIFLLFSYVLVQTGTRGTFIGYAFGIFVGITYLALFIKRYPQLRRYAIGALVAITVLGSLFVYNRDSEIIQSNEASARIANISFNDLDTRFTIWGMAYEGFKEKPVLGWGQGNFNYVFNKYYEPSLYAQESWFDRVHNIFFDWLIAGGVLGLLAYLSIFISALYYLFWRPIFQGDESFNVFQRAALIGILAGYFTHNLVVFDNIVSYIFFGLVLALIHSRVAEREIGWPNLDKRIVGQIVAPVVGVVLVLTIYTVNLPPMQAAWGIIDALRGPTIEARLSSFEDVLALDTFAHQEIVEQFAQQAIGLSSNNEIPVDVKNSFIDRAEAVVLELAERKPGDTRVHVFISSFYRSLGRTEEARIHMDIARELSPQKQEIIFQQAIIASEQGDFVKMRDLFEEAYNLYPGYEQARIFFGIGLLYNDEMERFREVIDEEFFPVFAANNSAVSTANQFGKTDLMREMFNSRIELNPTDAQNYASLGFLLYQSGENEEAIAVLNNAIEAVPEFADRGQCYIDNIAAGEDPATGCDSR